MSNFIKFSEATTLTIHAMIIIASDKKNMSTAKIAERINASYNHLSKVLQRLIKLGYLTSTRGPMGGFALAKLPQKISILELYEIHEGKVEEKYCPACFKKCVMLNREDCILGSAIKDFSIVLKEKLKKMTIADAVKKFRQGNSGEENGSLSFLLS